MTHVERCRQSVMVRPVHAGRGLRSFVPSAFNLAPEESSGSSWFDGCAEEEEGEQASFAPPTEDIAPINREVTVTMRESGGEKEGENKRRETVVTISSTHTSSYYTQGSSELATETLLTVKRLEPRRKLTKTGTRTVIALVGLPARGKSFVSRKLMQYMSWTGSTCKIFNVGRYRREAYAASQLDSPSDSRSVKGACDADFFDANNESAAELREKVAEIALNDMLRWLDEEDVDSDDDNLDISVSRHSAVSTFSTATGTPKLSFKPNERIAIFDATNSTNKRRQWILEQCTSPEKRQGKATGVVFVESICDDEELLEENYRYKVGSSPDFNGMPQEEAMADLRRRVAKYEAQYETIDDDRCSYIKIYNLSTKLLVNHIYGRMAKDLVPALMAWHIGTRPVFLCRPGQTISGLYTDGEDYVNLKKVDTKDPLFQKMSSGAKRRSLRGDSLGPNGQRFREDLLDFCYHESLEFVRKRSSVRDMAYTGTSLTGIAPASSSMVRSERSSIGYNSGAESDRDSIPDLGSTVKEPFPLRVYTSTMPRAGDTVNWEDFELPLNQMSNLNPLDKGDFAGMELDEIKKANPSWYEKLEADPFGTRFPGGESYRDLIARLTSIVIEIEQQVIPTLVVSHVSILQCLMAYFRNSPVEECMSIEVPLHTVVKFTPVRGGGWSESHHPLYKVKDDGSLPKVTSSGDLSQFSQSSAELNDDYNNSNSPIWIDGMPTPKSKALSRTNSLIPKRSNVQSLYVPH